MKLMRAGAVVLATLALVGCSAPTSGTIQDKDYQEGYYWTQFVCSGYSAQGVCTVQVPIQQYSPPRWSFDLYQSEDEHGWRSVSETTYNAYEVGDYYSEEEK